jgi:hypothetical protein
MRLEWVCLFESNVLKLVPLSTILGRFRSHIGETGENISTEVLRGFARVEFFIVRPFFPPPRLAYCDTENTTCPKIYYLMKKTLIKSKLVPLRWCMGIRARSDMKFGAMAGRSNLEPITTTYCTAEISRGTEKAIMDQTSVLMKNSK